MKERNKNKTHYRVLRSTVVLALSSHVINDILDKDLKKAIAQVQKKNYQFDQIDPVTLEVLYAAFDDDFTKKVRDEFIFYPGKGSVRVHASAIGVCELCGKGDSKETGDNRDHLRIEFQLKNIAGGKDTWCGSTCIVNFGLKVDGAATAEEAERLLGMSMRQAVRQFEIDAWRASNAGHEDIPGEYQELRNLVTTAEHYTRDYFGEMILLNLDPEQLGRVVRDILRQMRVSSRFYQREGYLTPKKQDGWVLARWALKQIRLTQRALDAARDIRDADARFEHFMELSNEQTEKVNVKAA